MKKIKILGLILISCSNLLFAESLSESYRIGLVLNYYNEPALKPGGTIGLDWEIPLANNWYSAVTLPEMGYFYFPHNYEAFYFYPEFSLRHIGEKGFYFSISASSGLSLSRKTVPVYNLEGEKIVDPFTKQLLLMIQVYFGFDRSVRPQPESYRIYGSIGWKGLYPNNLGIQSQPMMQIGINYMVNKKHDE